MTLNNFLKQNVVYICRLRNDLLRALLFLMTMKNTGFVHGSVCFYVTLMAQSYPFPLMVRRKDPFVNQFLLLIHPQPGSLPIPSPTDGNICFFFPLNILGVGRIPMSLM